jgi:outer membrane lipoprotein carrier protein
MRRLTVAAASAAVMLLTLSSARASAVDALRSFLAQTKTARGEFSQQVMRGSAQAAPPSSGTFVFERPGKFRWIYQKPYEQVLVADGAKLYLYDKDLNQVTVKKLSAALPASPASILFGTAEFEREFAVRDDGVRDGLAWLVATPKTKDSPYERIDIGFRDSTPAAMQIKDSFGQTSRLVFSSFERNPRVDAEVFRFVPPAGADVLEER